MAVRPILTLEDPRLRKKSIRVKRVDASIQGLIEDMLETMREGDGQGLAAPQIGVLLRVIVAEYVDEDTEDLHQMILVNPEITTREGSWMADEGCLSVPGYWGTVPRAERIAVRAKDRHGKELRFKSDGRMAHILQHEIDHLDGVLYVDYLKSLDDLQKVESATKRRRRRWRTRDGSDDMVEPAEPNGEVVEPSATQATSG
ncbi:MAG: def [Chloroflexi bacterium]|nr:def [Chloroflexota bacterium]